MRKFLLILVGVMFWSVSESLAIRFFDDANIPEWARLSIYSVQENNIMTGFGNGTFRPEKTLNRAEAVVILLRTKGIDFKDKARVKHIPFSDVPRGVWFADPIMAAVELGWLSGYPDGTVRPGKNLSRAEWATMVMRAFNLKREKNPHYEDVPSRAWFTKPVLTLAYNGLIREKGTKFRPTENVLRADAAWMIAQILKKPRLMGVSKKNNFSKIGSYRDARRTAIKPRNFNANKQGYQIEKKELLITAQPASEEDVLMSRNSDWTNFGTIRIKNNLDDRVEFHNMEFKLKMNMTNVGPPENFIIQIKTIGKTWEKNLTKIGSVFIGGMDFVIPAGEEKVIRVKLKANKEKSFYMKSGNGIFYIFRADASMISTFKRENPDRQGNFRSAPIKFVERNLSNIRFEP